MKQWNQIIRAHRVAYRHRRTWAAAITTAVLIALAIMVFLNRELIATTWALDFFDAQQKWNITLKSLTGFGSHFTALSGIFAILIVLLVADNVALFDYVRQMTKRGPRDAKSAIGIAAGFLGLGCAACGSLIIAPLLALFGAAGALTLLPLHGQEFAVIGIILIAWSISSLSKKLMDPKVCKIEE